MRIRILLFVLAGVLSMFYGAVAYLAIHPNVSPEYKAYFIDRTSSDWRPPRYNVSPDQGISFGVQGLPTFVQYLYGFSTPEPWGRWTDARHGATAGLVLAKPLTGAVCVMMKAMPAASQIGKPIIVRLGDQEQKVAFRPGTFSEQVLDFSESKPADTLEFIFDGPLPAQNTINHDSSDPRRLGLAVAYIRFASQDCKSAHQQIANGALDHIHTSTENLGHH